MVNKGAAGASTFATRTVDASLHSTADTTLATKVDQTLRHLLFILGPLLRQLFATRASASSKPAAANASFESSRAYQPSDSERTERSQKTTPTPSSYPSAAASSSAHPANEPARITQRRLESDTTRESSAAVLKRPETEQDPSIEYKLVLVQEPSIGAAFEDNLLGRIGLAAPLILELQILHDGKAHDACSELPFLICQCSLLDEHGSVADMVDQTVSASSKIAHLAPPTSTSAATSRGRKGRSATTSRRSAAGAASASTRSSESTERSTSGVSGDDTTTNTPATPVSQQDASSSGQASPQLARMLYGTIVAGPKQFNSTEGEAKPYFFFPEISIRTPGKFKISCKLMRLSLPGMPASQAGVLASVETKMFEVVKRSEYRAPYITDISRHFARQGVPLLLPPGVSAD